jgi:G:T/U-mismatch repair DNA glycosylase
LSSSLGGRKQETLKVLPSASVTKAMKRGTPRPSSSSSSNKKIKTLKETETVSANAASQSQTTHSFEPAWWGNSLSSITDTALVDVNTNNYPPIHTLILGTHPSITSLHQNELYAHTQNAFWYIVGDVLHFRRNAALSTSTTNNNKQNKPYATYYNYLRYSNIIPYKEQLELLVSKGFALWDIIATCERVKGSSLDVDIRNEEPNCIREFCEGRYPSLLPSSFKVDEEEVEGCKTTTNNNGNYVKCENNKYVNIQRIIIANGTTGAFCL